MAKNKADMPSDDGTGSEERNNSEKDKSEKPPPPPITKDVLLEGAALTEGVFVQLYEFRLLHEKYGEQESMGWIAEFLNTGNEGKPVHGSKSKIWIRDLDTIKVFKTGMEKSMDWD